MKITRIECIIHKKEYDIIQMNFYHNGERLLKAGIDNSIKILGDRKEVFEIADDEQLIGCELYYEKRFFSGVKWIKMKIMNWIS